MSSSSETINNNDESSQQPPQQQPEAAANEVGSPELDSEFECGPGSTTVENFNWGSWYQTYKDLKEIPTNATDEFKSKSFRRIWNHIRRGLPNIRYSPKNSNAHASNALLKLCSERDMIVVEKTLKPNELPTSLPSGLLNEDRTPIGHKKFKNTKDMGVKKKREKLRLLEVRLHPDTDHWAFIFDKLDDALRKAHLPVETTVTALQATGTSIEDNLSPLEMSNS